MVGGLIVEAYTYTHSLGHAGCILSLSFNSHFSTYDSTILLNSLTILVAYTKHANTPREARVTKVHLLTGEFAPTLSWDRTRPSQNLGAFHLYRATNPNCTGVKRFLSKNQVSSVGEKVLKQDDQHPTSPTYNPTSL